MKKICFFNSYPDWGGGIKFYIDFAIGMQELGHDVIGICTPNSLLTQKYLESNIRVHQLRVNNRSAFNPFKVLLLARLLKKETIDIIIFTTSEDLKLGALAAKIANVPTIIYRRGLAVPIKNRWTNRMIFQKLVTHILANSEETKRTILQNLSESVKESDIEVIYNGLQIDQRPQAKWSPSESIPLKGIILGNAGRLVPQKGQLMLVEIAEKLKQMGLEFTLLIAGAGEIHDELRDSINSKNLTDDVYLVGYVDNIAGFMKVIDVFLLTSLWEGFGYVLAEAALQSKPSVAFHISSNPEIVANGKTGTLVPVNDIQAFAKAVYELSTKKDLRTSFGEAAKKKVIDEFEIKAQIQKFEQFILS